MAAVLGVQLVISMVMASILSKLSTHLSFGRWLLVNHLVRYLHPTDEELRTLARIPTDKGRGGRNKHAPKNEAFTVPRNLDLHLEAAPIGPKDVLPLKFYLEFQWLMDFAMFGLIIFLMTELYYALMRPENEFNLSMLWCLLVTAFSVKVMFSLTVIYFRTEESGERILVIIFTMLFLIIAMAVMITSEDVLELGLEPGYHNFSQGARQFLEKQGMGTHGPASLTTLKIILAILAAVLGAFLTFPGLRLAKMHSDAFKYTDSALVSLCLSLNLVFPLLIVVMWLKPVMRDYLVHRGPYGRAPLLTSESFEAVRVAVLLVFCTFRFVLVWRHLQAHLNLAVEKVSALKKEAGRISSLELQQTITHVFYYLCVVALQYLAPLILLLYCTLMLKILGQVDLLTPFGVELPPLRSTPPSPSSSSSPPPAHSPLGSGMGETIASTAAQFSITLAALRSVFTPVFFRGVFTFLSWWICLAWFVTTAFGMVYYQYFTV